MSHFSHFANNFDDLRIGRVANWANYLHNYISCVVRDI